jgi:hypothetical protein
MRTIKKPPQFQTGPYIIYKEKMLSDVIASLTRSSIFMPYNLLHCFVELEAQRKLQPSTVIP